MGLIELKYTPLFMVMGLAIVLHILKDTVSVKISVTASKFSVFKTKVQKNTVWIMDDETTPHSTNIIKRVRSRIDI